MSATELSTESSRLHSLCTYLGSFPRRAVAPYIEVLSDPGDVILDPFCGSGTTVLTALELSRNAIGVDRNPLAYVLTRAKAAPPDLSDVLARLDYLAGDCRNSDGDGDRMPLELEAFFHPWVFKQLTYLRSRLSDDAVDNFIKAIVVGILHGRSRKTALGSIYLSVDMPNTFSMSPRYVSRYVSEHGLRRPPYDVFASCQARARSLLKNYVRNLVGTAFLADSTQLEHVIAPACTDLIVTSPPYLGLLRYGAFNWLRLWFLGEEADSVDKALDTTSSVERYESFMLSTLTQLAKVAKDGSHAVLFVGKLKGKRVASLATMLMHNVVPLTQWSIIGVTADVSTDGIKTTRIWGEGKRGDASNRDEVLLLRRQARI